ncbi:MAG: helicase-related protein, partial [Limisphaerales bacterium]
ALANLPVADLSLASDDLRKCLSGGVAFHSSDLDRDERMVIEQEFRKKESPLRVIIATTTLAMGINTPAEAIVIVGLEHPGPTPTAYTVAEYKNMVGRAGRLGFVDHGVSFLVALSPADEYRYWETYVRGTPEDLRSHFLSGETDVRSLILRVLASAFDSVNGLTPDELVEFLDSSFGVFLERQQRSNWAWEKGHIQSAIQELLNHGLIAQDDQKRVKLTPLGRLSGEAGVEVESIVRLVSVLSHLPVESITDPTLISAAQLTIEVDSVLFPMNRKSTRKEPQAWHSVLAQQGVAPAVMGNLSNWASEQHQPTLRAKKAAACLYWISDTPMKDIESALIQFGGAFGGAAGPVRSIASRTSDLLETVARVAELTHDGFQVGDRLSRLTVRLQVGVPGAMVGLAELFGNTLGRGDYLNLLAAGLRTQEALAAATDNELATALGGESSSQKVRIIRETLKSQGDNTAVQPMVPLPKYEP